MINPSPKYSGEPSAQALASGLATLGRYGDNYMVHAAEGETMVPKEVFDENPGLKQDLFRQMTMMGIKDPNRYVVGDALNSINPITGQPEFFFKKIFRAIKKVVKKAAPIIAPIIGNLIAPGIGGLIASGLVTKLQGGSWGDALKSAALSYGASALTSGIGSALQGTSVGDFIGAGTPKPGSTYGGRFMSGLGKGLSAPFSAAGNLFESGAENPLAQGIFGPRGLGTSGIFSGLAGTNANPSGFAQGDIGLFPSYQSTSALQGQGIDSVTGQYDYLKDSSASGFDPLRAGDTQNFRRVSGTEAQKGVKYSSGRIELMPESQVAQLRSVGALDSQGSLTPKGEKFMTQYKARLASGGGSGGTPKLPPGVRQEGDRLFFGNQEVTKSIPEGFSAVAKKPAELFGSELAAKIAAQGAVPAAIALATYALTPEEKSVEDYLKSNPMDPNRAAYDQWSAIADKSSAEAQSLKNQWYGQSQYSAAQLKGSFGANPISGITSPLFNIASSPGFEGVYDPANATKSNNIQGGLGNLGVSGLLSNNLAARDALMARAAGGEIVGPGTGTSDSIPARLSDGEFVMTAQAVRNAGNGDRDVGAARMYDMMNRFERGMA